LFHEKSHEQAQISHRWTEFLKKSPPFWHKLPKSIVFLVIEKFGLVEVVGFFALLLFELCLALVLQIVGPRPRSALARRLRRLARASLGRGPTICRTSARQRSKSNKTKNPTTSTSPNENEWVLGPRLENPKILMRSSPDPPYVLFWQATETLNLNV